MKGAFLRCTASAQREAARARRESRGVFSGLFSSQLPFLPAGWLTVCVDALCLPRLCVGGRVDAQPCFPVQVTVKTIENPPVRPLEQKAKVSVVVRVASSEQRTEVRT